MTKETRLLYKKWPSRKNKIDEYICYDLQQKYFTFIKL